MTLNLADDSRLDIQGERTAYRGTLTSVENGASVSFSVTLSLLP
jgi:hypothetical protein